MKILLVIVSLFFSLNLLSQNQCGPSLQGIGDIFPWGQGKAQPFPWTTIQGLWGVDGNPDLILKLKVIRQTPRLKQLEVEIYSRSESCTVPQMKGVGIVTSFEKNVVRANIDNKLIKLAVFKSLDLELNPQLCGEQIIAVSMIDLGFEYDTSYDALAPQYETANMVLKKIPMSLDMYCKKRN